jgi:hypothetical protein
MMGCVRTLRTALVLLALTASTNAQQSQWVHPNAQGQLVYGRDTKGVMLPDYSFAGYHAGGVALPTIPTQIKLSPSGADDTAALQHAIDAVSALPLNAAGSRGAVQLAPGVFHCAAALHIPASGVVLRGAGSGPDGTILQLTGDPHLGLSIAGKFAEKETGKATTLADAYVPFGTHTIHIANASQFHPGDLVRISKPVTDTWVRFMGLDHLIRPGVDEHWISGDLSVRRRIIAVSGNAITFEIALMDSYDARLTGANAVTVTPVAVSGQITETGIEDLRIEAPARSINLQDPHFDAIDMRSAADSWIRNVVMIDATSGITIDLNSERITTTRTDVTQHKPILSPAKPFQYSINGTQVLVDRATGSGDAVFYFATQARQQGPVVILNSSFRGNGNIEPHQRWSTGLLVDNCTVTGGGINLINRGTMGSGHGWTIGWGVVWNSTADSFTIQQAPGTITWAMGNRGALNSQPMPTSGGPKGPDLPSGLIESQGKPVTPQSLYLAQLAQRLGPAALKNIGYSSVDPAH